MSANLTAFPMDSKVTEMGEDGLPVYDRAFDSTDLREVYKTYFSNGYFAEVGTSMHVKAATGLTAIVQKGKVNIQGTLGFMDEDATVSFAAADKSNPRIDTVVARLDLSVDRRVIELDVLTGTAAASPTAPTLTRNSTVWELGLADVTIPVQAAAVSDTNIKDTRLDTTRCGVVNPFAKLDTDSLFTQVTAIINKADADTTANIERLQNEVSATITQAKSDTSAAISQVQADTATAIAKVNKDVNDTITAANTKISDTIFKAESDVSQAITADKSALDKNVEELDEATAKAVSAMNDAISSTVLSTVWRLQSTSSADYLAYGDDLNNISAPCTKFSESASVTGGISNKPSEVTGAFVLYTFATEQDPSRLGQMLLEVSATGVAQFFRSGAGSSWTAWGSVGGADQTARDAAAEAQDTADIALDTSQALKVFTSNAPYGDDFNNYYVSGSYHVEGVLAWTNGPDFSREALCAPSDISEGYLYVLNKDDNAAIVIQKLVLAPFGGEKTGIRVPLICYRYMDPSGWSNWVPVPFTTAATQIPTEVGALGANEGYEIAQSANAARAVADSAQQAANDAAAAAETAKGYAKWTLVAKGALGPTVVTSDGGGQANSFDVVLADNISPLDLSEWLLFVGNTPTGDLWVFKASGMLNRPISNDQTLLLGFTRTTCLQSQSLTVQNIQTFTTYYVPIVVTFTTNKTLKVQIPDSPAWVEGGTKKFYFPTEVRTVFNTKGAITSTTTEDTQTYTTDLKAFLYAKKLY